jgi:hypothetical protein
MNPPRSLPSHPDPSTANPDGQPPPHAPKSKRLPRKRTLREEMQLLEMELELEDTDREWKSDVEALERFARTCRAARVVTLDSEIWRCVPSLPLYVMGGLDGLRCRFPEHSVCGRMSRHSRSAQRKTRCSSSSSTGTTGADSTSSSELSTFSHTTQVTDNMHFAARGAALTACTSRSLPCVAFLSVWECRPLIPRARSTFAGARRSLCTRRRT